MKGETTMIITLKDGSKKEYAEAKAVIDIAYDISEGLARAACAGEVNGEVVDLRTVLDSDCELNILTAKDEKGLAVLRHTASHVMAQAVQNLYPEAKPLNYDDNGITGPDWGHSEVVFGCFPIRCFQHFTSLSVTFHSLLVSSTCFLFLFLWFIISAVFLFVNAC